MGNSIGSKKKAKVMKITGETFKLTTPVQASDVTKDYPGHVLLESKAVKQFGIRAKPLEPQECLEAKKIYFLVELPKPPEEEITTRRVRSSVNMTAMDRLECLMLSRRSVSDLSVVRPISNEHGPVRVRMRLPRAEVEKLIKESRDEAEVAQRIVELYANKNGGEMAGGRLEGR